VTPLSGLLRLRHLDLTNTPVTDLAPLAGLHELRWLNVRGVHADLSMLSHLTSCRIVAAPELPRSRRR